MTRDWSLVRGNPAPGNPTLIRDLAGMIATAASDAYDAQASLDGIAADLGATGWEGDAARAFDEAFSPLPGDLGLMAASYDGAARALSVYADRLEAIQAAARQALTRAELASYRREVADERLAAARGRILDLGRQLAVTRAQEEAAELARERLERVLDAEDVLTDLAILVGAARRPRLEVRGAQSERIHQERVTQVPFVEHLRDGEAAARRARIA